MENFGQRGKLDVLRTGSYLMAAYYRPIKRGGRGHALGD